MPLRFTNQQPVGTNPISRGKATVRAELNFVEHQDNKTLLDDGAPFHSSVCS